MLAMAAMLGRPAIQLKMPRPDAYVRQLRRHVHLPMRIHRRDDFQPLCDAGFAGVDLLTATDQANDHSPIVMAIQT